MKHLVFRSNFPGLFRASALIGFLLLSSFVAAHGQTTTFAQFFEQNGTQDFVFTNNTTSADFTTVGGGSPIFFLYQNLPGLDASLLGIQNAHLTVTTTTTQTGTGGPPYTQPLNQQVTVAIIRDTPAPVGRNSRTNLLTVVFLPSSNTPGITGSNNSATLSVTTPDQNVIFTSDFLLFHQTTARNLALSFSSVTPALGLGAGSFLQSFTAAGSGTFASNPLPTLPGPTASDVSISGRVSTSNGRGIRGAEVVLLTSDGAVHKTRTKTFGEFDFDGIPSGQTVVISVNSKNHTFASQVISLQDDALGLVFVAQP
jgi:Carboxypeptidase regulatory-like domain